MVISYIVLPTTAVLSNVKDGLSSNKPDKQLCSSEHVKKSLNASDRDSSLNSCSLTLDIIWSVIVIVVDSCHVL